MHTQWKLTEATYTQSHTEDEQLVPMRVAFLCSAMRISANFLPPIEEMVALSKIK